MSHLSRPSVGLVPVRCDLARAVPRLRLFDDLRARPDCSFRHVGAQRHLPTDVLRASLPASCFTRPAGRRRPRAMVVRAPVGRAPERPRDRHLLRQHGVRCAWAAPSALRLCRAAPGPMVHQVGARVPDGVASRRRCPHQALQIVDLPYIRRRQLRWYLAGAPVGPQELQTSF